MNRYHYFVQKIVSKFLSMKMGELTIFGLSKSKIFDECRELKSEQRTAVRSAKRQCASCKSGSIKLATEPGRTEPVHYRTGFKKDV